MRYYSHYIWESGSEEKDNPVSVVLQQVGRKKHHYLLACVCSALGGDAQRSGKEDSCGQRSGGEDVPSQISGYFTERLTEWFHKQFLEIIMRRRVCSDDIYRSLERELEKIRQELADYCRQKNQEDVYNVRGILLCDDYFCLFQRGENGIYLFNRRFNRMKRKRLQVQTRRELTLLQGRAQKQIGILLCTPEFGSSISEEEMIRVLFEEALDDRKIEKRLREIHRADLDRGITAAAGAVFIRLE